MQSCIVCWNYLLWVQCAVSLLCSWLIGLKSTVGLEATVSYWFWLSAFLCAPSPPQCCVLLAPGYAACQPQGTALASSHLLCCCPEPVLSPAVGLTSLRRVELRAQVNRWAAVSQEWNFSPIGFRDFRLGGWSGGKPLQSTTFHGLR